MTRVLAVLLALAPAVTASAAAVAAPAAPAFGAPLPGAPATAAELRNDTSTVSYFVDGVQVIQRRLAASEMVSVNLYLLGGSAQLDAATAGVETLLLRVSEFGTASFPGREARLALARTGSRIVLQPYPDWTLFGFRSMRSDFDSTWAVFADRLMHPVLDSAAVEVVRARMVRWARNESMHPDAQARRMVRDIAFAGHPYAHDPDGTEASLAALTPDALRDYRDTQMVTSRMLLVVVGNMEQAQVEAAVRRTLGQLPRGSYRWQPPPAWAAPRTTVTSHERRLPTNYVLGYFSGPQSTSRDYQPFRIATMILGSLAFSDIRENGLSYAAGAPFHGGAVASGGVYVTTARPDTAVRIFNHTITRMQEHVVPRSVLQRFFRGFITEYYSLNESSAAQADFLARHQLLHGDWRLAGRYMEELRSIQGTDLRRIARNYFKNIQYVYIGNPLLVPTADMMKH